MKAKYVNIEFNALNCVSKDMYFIRSSIDENQYLHRVNIFSFITTCIDSDYHLREGILGAAILRESEANKIIRTCGIPHLEKVMLRQIIKPDYSFN